VTENKFVTRSIHVFSMEPDCEVVEDNGRIKPYVLSITLPLVAVVHHSLRWVVTRRRHNRVVIALHTVSLWFTRDIASWQAFTKQGCTSLATAVKYQRAIRILSTSAP